MDLILVRHALPLPLRVARGEVADPPLCEEGRAQAQRLAQWIAAEQVDAIYTSPMRRAAETAELLAEELGVETQLVAELVERDHQSSEYVPLEELKVTDYPRWRSLVVEGGLYSGVNLQAFRRNVIEALEGIIASHRGDTVVVSTHGSVINAFTSHLLGQEGLLVFEPAYTGINRYRAARTGERSIVALNETGHLR